jgi:hypothetical protein
MAEFVPTPEQQKKIEEIRAAREARRNLPRTAPERPEKYDFAPGLDPQGRPYPVHERGADHPGERSGEGPPDGSTADPPAAGQVEDHEWDGATLRATYREDELLVRDRISDAARDAQWATLFEIVGPRINRTRPGGKEGFAPLHQAAWHGAPVDVVQQLIARGAWRTLRTAAGRTALEIAAEREHAHLAGILRPVIRHPLDESLLRGLENQLHLLIRGRSAELVVKWQLRLPQLAPLTELTEPKLSFPVPGQEGGYSVELRGDVLRVASWNRNLKGWAQIHAVTRTSIQLTDDAWDLRIPDEAR